MTSEQLSILAGDPKEQFLSVAEVICNLERGCGLDEERDLTEEGDILIYHWQAPPQAMVPVVDLRAVYKSPPRGIFEIDEAVFSLPDEGVEVAVRSNSPASLFRRETIRDVLDVCRGYLVHPHSICMEARRSETIAGPSITVIDKRVLPLEVRTGRILA